MGGQLEVRFPPDDVDGVLSMALEELGPLAVYRYDPRGSTVVFGSEAAWRAAIQMMRDYAEDRDAQETDPEDVARCLRNIDLIEGAVRAASSRASSRGGGVEAQVLKDEGGRKFQGSRRALRPSGRGGGAGGALPKKRGEA